MGCWRATVGPKATNLRARAARGHARLHHKYGSHIYGIMKKVTFTLDDQAIRVLERASERLEIPKSQVVREALELYDEQLGRLGDEERARMLATFDRMLPSLPERPRAEVDRELAAVRRARRSPGRASPEPSGA